MAEKLTLEKAAFGAGVRFLRAIRRLTQKALAEQGGAKLTGSQISAYEGGEREPTEPKVRALAEGLHVPAPVLRGLQEVILRYVNTHSADFYTLLRGSGLLAGIDEVKEPPATYGDDRAERLLRERWQELAREQGSAKEREVLLIFETVSVQLSQASRRTPDEGP